MKTIERKISLETFISRVPSIWPSYKDNILYYFDEESLKNREYEFTCNYGMIPLSIAFSGETFEKVKENNFQLCQNCDNANELFVLSFETISNWYSFFKNYYSLLNDHCHCKTYTSAAEYYMFESNSIYASQMIYGQSEETYTNLDKLFDERGGEAFYHWICKYVIPSFMIPKEYQDYWKTKQIYYSDVLKWIAWFMERNDYNDKYSYKASTSASSESWKCSKEDGNFCGCEEYFKRGGQKMLLSLENWYHSIQNNLTFLKNIIKGENIKYYAPSMISEIELSNSLDDLGQFSILSSEYELGKDYRVAENYGDNTNTKGGTVVNVDGNPMKLKNGKIGYTFDKTYMENHFDDEAWDDYTKSYISENPDSFISSSYTYYAFDENNKIYTGTSVDDVINSMSAITVCPITWVKGVVIENTIYPINESEYGIYDVTKIHNINKKYFVYREDFTNTPYTILDGEKIYADLYPYEVKNYSGITEPFCYYFTFFKSNSYSKPTDVCDNNIVGNFNINNYKQFFKKVSSNDLIRYITYNGVTYEIGQTDTSITINNTEYLVIEGYAYDDNGNIMYVVNSGSTNVVLIKEIDENYSIKNNSKVENDNVYLGIEYNPIVYNANVITGFTSSKLKSLETVNRLVDDVGNQIDGIYKLDGIPNNRAVNHQPPQGSELELLYQVRNVSNITRYNEDEDQNLFVGNKIQNMIFYYKDISGNKVDDTVVDLSTSNFTSSLQAITRSTTLMNNLINITFDTSGIYCDITYLIGATLRRRGAVYYIPSHYSSGVVYTETVKFVKTRTEYYLKKERPKQIPTKRNSVSAHSISYPIYVWKLEQETQEIHDDTNDIIYNEPVAKFKSIINLVNEDLTTTYDNYNDLDSYNSLHVYPIFREEYLLGISVMENVDSDIYIERGINAAFEKHLKLGEVTSLENLVQYGNNFFKIMDK